MNGWTRGQIGDRESLVGLLKRGEWNQMHFSQVLRESHGLRLTQNGAVYLARDGKNGARAALYISRGGALHCCFEPEELRKEDTRIFSRILSERNLFSLIGRKDRIALIEEIYNPAASFSVDYDLMVRQAESDRFDRDDLGTDYLIRRAGREDFADLYPLEEAYQKEEVLRNPEALNARFLKKNFMKTLETSYVWPFTVREGPSPRRHQCGRLQLLSARRCLYHPRREGKGLGNSAD